MTRISMSIVIACLALTACSTLKLGHDFDIQTFASQVVNGESTRSEVKDWLGTPDSTGIAVHADGKRSEKWTYYYGYGTLPGLKNASIKLLEVEFDEQGRVYSYSWSQ